MEIAGDLAFDQGLSDLTGFAQDGREFAVVGLIDSVAAAFVDITDPENPFEVGRISGTPNTWRDLKYWNRHVYIGTEANDGIKVVSVDNPDNPILIYTITDFGSSHNIHIDADGYLYIIGSTEYAILIYDLSIPELPELVGTWNDEYLHDIEVFNNKLYGAGIYSGYFYIIDVNDKTNPQTILSHYTGLDGISTHDCAVTDDEQYLITADETSGGHIKIWDISDYDNINLVSEYMTHPEHSVHNVYVRPGTNLVIMSYYVDGTRVLDISDPANPVEVGYFDTSDLTGLYDGNWGTYAYLPSGHIISSDRQNGLFIFSSPLSDEALEWVACGPIAPLKPSLTAEALLDTIILNWDNVSENSIDGATDLQDFEGYRIYRSIDGGETWGNEEDMIYDYTGVHVGWTPYVQFDYTYDVDTLLYGYDISGADPLAPWIDLGSNTGIKYSFTDLDVYPYAEYCYVITAYDIGIQPSYMSDGGILYEDGYVSLESDFHNMACLSPITPDFYTPPSENIFIESDTNIGWGKVSYIPHSVDTVNTGLYKFEIQAEIDSITFLLSETLNPKLFIYEVDESGSPTESSPLSVENIDVDSLNILMGMPGVEYDLDNEIIYLPNYLSDSYLIYPIDSDMNSWLDILGMYIKIENHYTLMNNPIGLVELEEIIFSDTLLFDIIDVKMKYNSASDVLLQPYFDYQIEFSSSIMDTAVYGVGRRCDQYEGYPENSHTMLPFKITNLTLNNQADLSHFDKGIYYGQLVFGEVNGNCLTACVPGKICVEGQCLESPGYENCHWERHEMLRLEEILPDGVDDNIYDLKIGFNMEGYYNYVGADPLTTDTWVEGETYLSGEIIYHEGMLWEATEDISIDNTPDEWFDNNNDNINDNPWQMLYPWEDGDSAIISIRKKLHDGDSWLIDTDLFNQSALNNSDSAVKPESFKLGAPYPNPFNPVIAIEYSLSYTSKIKLTIYDLLGRQVEILYNGKQYLGNYIISWDASNYSSGVYFIKMNVGDSQAFISNSQKLVLLK